MVTKVYLGLGTNLGNKEENLTRAIEHLSLVLGPCAAQSPFIETAPWGFESNNSFLNCAVAFDTHLAPLELLDTTERIERELGRTLKSEGGNYHDRIIDIDILLYENLIVDTPDLQIPHPHLLDRAFVYQPLIEIAPHITHPNKKRTIASMVN